MLVANRGEIARRVFRTCRELGIATVAVLLRRRRRRAARRARPTRRSGCPGDAPRETYLRGDLIVAGGPGGGADAVHPGYGFLSENAGFARACSTPG